MTNGSMKKCKTCTRRHSSKFLDWAMIVILALLDEFLPEIIKLHYQCIPYEDGTNDNPCSTDLNGRDAEINYPYVKDTVTPESLEINALIAIIAVFFSNVLITKMFDKFSILPLFSSIHNRFKRRKSNDDAQLKLINPSNIDSDDINDTTSDENVGNGTSRFENNINIKVNQKLRLKCGLVDHFGTIVSKFECYFRVCLISILVTSVITGVIKESVGRPRPDYYNYSLIDPIDSHLAFPSGHTSFSFSVFLLLSLFLFKSLITTRAIRFYSLQKEQHVQKQRQIQMSRVFENSINDENINIHVSKQNSIDSKSGTGTFTADTNTMSTGSSGSLMAEIVDTVDSDELYDIDIDHNALNAFGIGMHQQQQKIERKIGNKIGLSSYFGSGSMYSIQKQTFINYLINFGANAKRLSFVSVDITNGNGSDNVISEKYYSIGSKSMYENGNVYFGMIIWYYLRNNIVLSTIIAFIPTFYAIYVGCTRITDYRHRVSDVLAGALLGSVVAYITFRLYSFEFYGNLRFDPRIRYDVSNKQVPSQRGGGVQRRVSSESGNVEVNISDIGDDNDRKDNNDGNGDRENEEYGFKPFNSSNVLMTPRSAKKLKQTMGVYSELVPVGNSNNRAKKMAVNDESDNDDE